MSSSRLTTIVVAIAAAAFACALVFGLSWRRHHTRTPDPAPIAAPAPRVQDPRDLLKDLPRDVSLYLTAPASDRPARFVLLPWIVPRAFCDGLQRAGLTGATLHEDEPPARGWTCVTDLVKPAAGPDEETSSLFVSARGLEPGRLDVIRLKLNLLDARTAPAVRRAAREALRAIFAQFRWRPSEAALAAIDQLREQRFLERGAQFEFLREFGDAPRFNLIVTFPRTLPPGPADRYAPVRRPLQTPPPAPVDTAPDEADAAR
ncbi:DUF6030 family protein [Methylopila henanensis]|uniref:DUF6030 family protein n=1 Tax=Methylopila henanensis TaxID=873516 RepID=A0ABW4KCR4_9HYPH